MKVDIAQVMDEGRWTAYQKMLVGVTALAIILDGLDIQLLSHAVTSMGEEWHLKQPAFSSALAISGLGMLLGGALCGWLSDRIGRRTALALSVFSFAAFTIAIAAVRDVGTLTLLRFLSGLGLGGALPTAAALASEYVPRRRRAMAVTRTIVCVPLGGMLAAWVAEYVVPNFGWRMLFIVGGVVPILVGLLIVTILPESPGYLVRHEKRWAELRAFLGKLGHAFDSQTEFTAPELAHREKGRAALLHLFSREYVGDTLALFGSFFFGLLVNYVAFTRFVTALNGIGFTKPAASGALGWWNTGGVAGALLGGLLIQWLGSRITMLGLSLVAVASAFVLANMHLDPNHTFGFLLMCIILGGTVNAVQTTMYALAAHVYPTDFRGTGIGTAVAVGRIGAILAPFTADFALARGGVSAYFGIFGVGMTLTLLCLMAVRRHVGRSSAPSMQLGVLAAASE